MSASSEAPCTTGEELCTSSKQREDAAVAATAKTFVALAAKWHAAGLCPTVRAGIAVARSTVEAQYTDQLNRAMALAYALVDTSEGIKEPSL